MLTHTQQKTVYAHGLAPQKSAEKNIQTMTSISREQAKTSAVVSLKAGYKQNCTPATLGKRIAGAVRCYQRAGWQARHVVVQYADARDNAPLDALAFNVYITRLMNSYRIWQVRKCGIKPQWLMAIALAELPSGAWVPHAHLVLAVQADGSGIKFKSLALHYGLRARWEKIHNITATGYYIQKNLRSEYPEFEIAQRLRLTRNPHFFSIVDSW